MSEANKRQIGGNHYKKGGEEHWDRAWRLKYDPFQYIITKWVERWRDKGGVEDLRKAQHAIAKYIEVVEEEARCGAALEKSMLAVDVASYGGDNSIDLSNWPHPAPLAPVEGLSKDASVIGMVGAVHPDAVGFGATRAPDGWIGFTYEGGTRDGDLYRCTHCRALFTVPVHADPHAHHVCPPAGEPTAGYVAQD